MEHHDGETLADILCIGRPLHPYRAVKLFYSNR